MKGATWKGKQIISLFSSILMFVSTVVLAIPANKSYAATNTIVNPGFETGDLTGWTVVHGQAFSQADVTDETTFWNKQAFGQHNFWHIWGGAGDNAKVGVLESETFTLGGDGQIDFQVGGDQDLNQLYIALVRESDDAILMKATGTGSDAYSTVNWDASAYTGTVVKIRVVDQSTTGHINLDDVNVPPTPSLHNHTEPAIYNHDFEYTELVPFVIRGWNQVSGDAFAPSSLTHQELYSEGGAFRHADSYHLWSFKDGGDGQVGELRSTTFTLGGNGGIDFLISGGQDIDNLYVALVRASDGAELFRETGRNSEAYQRVFWNASAYVGQDVYIQIVDNQTGGWGHINVDDFHVLNSVFAGGLLGEWSLNEGTGTQAMETVTGTSDPIDYHLNTGVYQPAQDPMWKSDGIRSHALLFDGYSTWITRTPDEIPAPKRAITLEAWVAPRNFEHGDENRLSAIINQHDREAKEGYILGHFRHGTWGLQFGADGNWREIMTDSLLPLNEWTHITATYDSLTGEAVLYQNGEKVASADFPAGEEITPSVNDLLIGKNNDGMWLYGYTMNMFSGLLDEVKIYNEARTAAQVKQAYDLDIQALGGNLPTVDRTIDRSLLAADKHRPQFHASPPTAWGNEPGGPIYFNGQYHLFYQSNPRGPFWNHIRFGHLVSDDMVHWRDVDDAVIPGYQNVDPEGAWAGTSVVDDQNVPVIFYTAGDDRLRATLGSNQNINIARSTYPMDGDNDLNRWEKSPELIVTQEPGEGIPGEFRDPFVFKDGNEWFMLVTSGIQDGQGQSVGGTALVYSTTDSSFESDWTFRGELYVGDFNSYPLTGRVWELPILLPLGNSGKHIFLINPAKVDRNEDQSRYTFYWIGTWDAATARFTPDDPEPQMFDVGQHFTGPAGMVTPDGRTIIHSITQGRRTATQDYDAGYAHNYGLPVSVSLRPDGRLGVEPISELDSLRGQQLVNITSDTSFANANQILSSVSGDMLEIQLELDSGLANEAGLSVRRSPNGEEETIVYYKKSSKEFFVNRTKASLNEDTDKWFQGGVVDIGTESIQMHMYVDRSQIETYLNGLKGLTTRTYPTRNDATGVQLWANEQPNTVVVKSLQIWEMNSAYTPVNPTGISLSPASMTLIEGDTERLTPTIAPAQATNKDVIWTSSNPAVATVVNGNVTGQMPGTATITAKTRTGLHTATAAITVTAEPAHDGLLNHDFEDGLTGWTVVSGDAFGALDVTVADDWGWGGPFNQNGNRHLWGVKDGSDAQTGVLTSQTFTLGGNGQIDFLVGGGNDIYDLYVSLVRASDGKELMKASGGNKESYTRIYWDASDYIGQQLYIKIVDRETGAWGHLNVDDVNVPVEPPVNSTLTNPGFETGDLAGWTVTGDAFTVADVTSDTGWGWGGPFHHEGTYHLWGFKDGADTQVGTLQSTPFTLHGSGWIDFLIGGGEDLNQLYVALVRAADGTELMKATGHQDEAYRRVFWDASAYVGEELYVKIVDTATGGWGHLNVDDFHVFNSTSAIVTEDRYQMYRPAHRYTAEKHWLNDPNGLVYYDGEYHLFYQHNPTGNTWGPMYWGHAVSTDLISWTELPIALEPDQNGFAWSGSVVIDWNNTTGFQEGKEPPMVAMYTSEKAGVQTQSLAYSLDKGRTWTKYAGNPVIPMPADLGVFRDPKVFWHEETNRWVMVIAAENKSGGQFIRIFHSSDMKSWTFASDFGLTDGNHNGVWEVPDLFELPVDGNPNQTKWVMQVSLSSGAPAGGSGMQYFIGDFDGITFTNANPPSTALYSEYGSDFYAAITFSDMPVTDNRRIQIGWMNNWSYGQAIPATIFRSAMSLPRELTLQTTDNGIRLVQSRVSEVESYRGAGQSWSPQSLAVGNNLLSGVNGTVGEIMAQFDVTGTAATEFGFKVRKGASEETIIGYDVVNQKLFVDRTQSGEDHFSAAFSARHEATMVPQNGKIRIRILIDRSSVEVFGQDGEVLFTEQIFPRLTSDQLEVYTKDGQIQLDQLDWFAM
ncbi:GH32 C-terminal domain-containing protein [Marinicrinis sediminis]|uniref:GH32 C-terminal domain-containing protein n=1 Tax=Marinicrinis sediminis TaxID=1652465 RepID=A0ABW5R917_9BACL